MENHQLSDPFDENIGIEELLRIWNYEKITDISLKILSIGSRIHFMSEPNYNNLLNKISEPYLKEIISGIRHTTDMMELFNFAFLVKSGYFRNLG